MVDLLFELYPCQKCRTHINALKPLLMDGMCQSIASNNQSDITVQCDARASVDAIVLWAFRLHNEVTRHVEQDIGYSSEESAYFLKLEKESDKVILKKMDELYNIVYD